jgi:hypothetical protein
MLAESRMQRSITYDYAIGVDVVGEGQSFCKPGIWNTGVAVVGVVGRHCECIRIVEGAVCKSLLQIEG